ncbi:MAG: rhomboid family intramembrane serine protease [Kiloniellales bacterium]
MPFLPLHDDNPRILIAWPWVTWGLMLACVLVFAVQWLAGPDTNEHLIVGLGIIPASLTGQAVLPPELALVPAPLTLVASLFLHGGFMHLVGNLLYLWVFGDNVEDGMGHPRFLVFYLLCGVAAGLIHVLSEPGSTVATIGASGAISGILGAYLVLHPRARVLVPVIFYIPIYLPAYVLLIFWIGFQILSATATDSLGDIAWWAHIGGFFVGAVLVVPFRHKAIPLFGAKDPPRGIRVTKGSWRRRGGQGGRRGPWGRG